MSCVAMTKPKPSPGLLLSSTSKDLLSTAPLPSGCVLDTAPKALEEGRRGPCMATSSTPTQSRGSMVRVTGTESRKLVLWIKGGSSLEGDWEDRVLWLFVGPSEEGDIKSGGPWAGGTLLYEFGVTGEGMFPIEEYRWEHGCYLVIWWRKLFASSFG